MPTSTIWRQNAGNPSLRGASPVRPSGDAIERISPEPSFPHTFSDPAYHNSSSYRSQDSIQGLGLLHAGIVGTTTSSQPPEELYIDRSGGAHIRNRANDTRGRPQHHQSSTQDWASRSSKQSRSYRSNKGKGHTRSGSTIDDLASAAIATSPTFANGSPQAYFFNGSPTSYTPTRPSTSHLSSLGFQDQIYEPPAKRVKSERLPAVQWNNQPPRPTTSYHQNSTMSEEAELLLGLRTELNFKQHASPPTRPVEIHKSPTRFPPKLSPISAPIAEKDEKDVSDLMALEMPYVHVSPIPHVVEPVRNGVNPLEQNTPDVASDKMDIDVAVVPAPEPSVENPKLGAIPVSDPALEVKKTRRIKPQVQAEVCAECSKLQRESDGEDATISWISCNACNRWFHASCVGFKGKSEARSVDKFVCKQCEPEHGPTTFVRKSSRARTAIDYAGLNQGVVKSSIETSMHHYIQPIKSGKFAIQRDDFARVRPELLTVEFMENFDNMKRPFVVPACWNPRFGTSRANENQTDIDKEPISEQLYSSAGEQLDSGPEPVTETGEDPVIDCDQDLLDMVMPRDLTVRKVAQLYGSQELVDVIDVKTQGTKGAWTLEKWADYYEQPGEKTIRNVISLEVSNSPIGRLVRRPKVVRDLDLEDEVWDAEARAGQKKKPVQYYCLMSVADSYTDFHIDFGGSSVYYHILKGTKTFFFIPPEGRYLKKYEEWCNSQDQNDTWLPDLCNGCVTRVDLHEGDTAFIPAGWIHSVWTPEDSLVIGGNYLTRIDYELQLKVANIEKLTKVTQKFRYPFFQKVMWYTLLKYLEEDPVPEEVLLDFEDDSEYTFLRANPIWHEIGDLANTAEPGSIEYNARCYPKSELKGLLPLRDYLYRTARIHADLPVPDINKKQIEAVKSSVPKGHGDPLALIKTFAIWCAWKWGSVTAPDWVYSDEGGFLELDKKVKKAESVRVPGERASLRRAAHNVPRESTDYAVVTPQKPSIDSPGVNSDVAKKVKSASHKPSGTRTACDACRKRRIRCPHKEGTSSPGALESMPLSRSQSPAIIPVVNGMMGNTAIAAMPDALPSLDADQGTIYVSSNLSAATLPATDAYDVNGMMVNGTPSGKKSRSKACEECRKSKRRCVHDENGRVDPAKAAEPSKPRGSSNTKRPSRPSDESLQAKRMRMEDDTDDNGFSQPANIDEMIDPALFEQAIIPSDDAMQVDLPDETNELRDRPESEEQSADFVTPMEEPDVEVDEDVLPSITVETGTMTAVKEEPVAVAAMPVQEPSTDTNATIAGYENSVEETKPELQDELPKANGSPVQRHSSRQPKQVERFMPEDNRSPTKPQPKPAGSDRRRSSAASGQTIVNSVKTRRSSSNTSRTTHQMAAMVNQSISPTAAGPVSRGSTVDSDDPDEKMARELQAEEHGLRRRQSVRL